MNILEKDLEEIIEKTPVENLREKGLYVHGRCFRQLRIGNYGVADLIYVSKDYHFDEMGNIVPYLEINILEIKKDKAGISAFLQAVRYSKGVSRYLDSRGFKNYKLQISLIAPEIDKDSDYIFLTDMLLSSEIRSISCLNNYEIVLDFNGISFDRKYGFYMSNEKFNK